MQNSEDEGLLRKVLYDAIILVDYPFLDPKRAIHIPAHHMRSLYLTRLIVTHEAIEYLRYEILTNRLHFQEGTGVKKK